MKNIPDKIYLQIGEACSDCPIDEDFKNLDGITWCEERINSNDIVYYRRKKKKEKK